MMLPAPPDGEEDQPSDGEEDQLEYAREQRDRFASGRLPADFWQAQGADVRQLCDYNFSDLGRDLMLLNE